MNEGSRSSAANPRRPRGVLLEAVVVVAAGMLLALLANFISPRGIQLGRDYFPKPGLAAVAIAQPSADTTVASSETNAIFARLRAHGLQPLEQATVLALFNDPKRAQELIAFVDVRNDELYQAGHIPGAHQLDYYRPEAYLPAVLTACMAAEKIVVYCTGGDCEDSELAAMMLGQAGVPRERIFVYPGGFTEWSARNLPLELGARASGVMKGGGP